jgi:predicted DsbA family dithiol-disulfide isomerase
MDRAHRKPRRKTAQRPATDNLVERIRETLLYFGGEAHRRDVIANVAREVGVDVKNIPEDFESAVIVSFEETWRDEARRALYGFHLRFGEGSHRWGLKAATAH